MVIRPTAEAGGSFRRPGLEYVLTYFDNPGVVMPPAITSWVAQKQMPDFLRKLHLATVEYARSQSVRRATAAAEEVDADGDEDDEDDMSDESTAAASTPKVLGWSCLPPDPGFEYPPDVVLRFAMALAGEESKDRKKRRSGGDGGDERGGGDKGASELTLFALDEQSISTFLFLRRFRKLQNATAGGSTCWRTPTT